MAESQHETVPMQSHVSLANINEDDEQEEVAQLMKKEHILIKVVNNK